MNREGGKTMSAWEKAGWMGVVIALALAVVRAVGVELPPVPQAVLVAPGRTYYFVATAVAGGVESEYSNAVSATNGRPTLAWDRGTNVEGYRIYRGTNPGVYSASWEAGSNTWFTVPAPAVKTNLVHISIVSQNATNIRYRPWGGTWMWCGWTNKTLTNPPIGVEYEAVGRSKTKPPRMQIQAEWR